MKRKRSNEGVPDPAVTQFVICLVKATEELRTALAAIQSLGTDFDQPREMVAQFHDAINAIINVGAVEEN